MPTEEAQIAFVSPLTASAVGLAATGSMDYGWNSFENAFKNGLVFQREEENNCGALSQIVIEKMEDRGDPPDRCDRHRPA